MNTVSLDPRVVEELEPGLIGYARRRVGRADLAEDLVQETWIAAMGSIGSFAGRSSLRTWLISILRRKIVDSYRRQRPQVTFDDGHHAETGGFSDTRLDDEKAVKKVHEEIEHLPEGERRAILLCDIEGLDRDAAARRMGVTRGHLRVLLHRGRHKLRVTLEAMERPIAA